MPSQFGGVAVDQPDVPATGSKFGGTPVDDTTKPIGLADTVRDQMLQGATFGLGNRAEAGLGALIASGLGAAGVNGYSDSISDNYKKARDIETQRLEDQFQQHPAPAIAANLAGGLSTGGLGLETKLGTLAANSLRSGNLAARVGKGALAGAASGAAYGAGTAPYDQSGEGAESGVLGGAITGGAIPGAGAVASDVAGTLGNAAKGLIAKSPEAIQDTAALLKNKASALYDQMRDVGATLNPQSTQDLTDSLDQAVNSKNFIPALNPKTTAIVDHIKQSAAQGDLGIDQLDQYRRLLGRVGNTEDGVSAGSVRNAIDDHVNGLTGADLSNGSTDAVNLLNQGRQQYQQASKVENIADILTKADGDPNKIKSGLTRFLNNDSNTRGWNDDEISALRSAASNGGTEGLLKLAGRFGIDTSNLGSLSHAGGAILAGTATSPVAPVLGTAANILQRSSAQGKAQTLIDVLQGQLKKAPVSPYSGLLAPPASGAVIEQQNQPQLPSPAQIIQQPTMQPHVDNQPNSMPDTNGFARAESGNNPNAQSKTSSASGLYGFTNKTWADMVSKYGQQTGIGLQDKNNPQAQQVMVGLLAKDNIQSLQNTLGRMPTKPELYAAHVFGANGAAKLINADPMREAITIFPRPVVDANRNLFFDGRRPRTAAELQQVLTNKIS